jgi:hypothetical protein
MLCNHTPNGYIQGATEYKKLIFEGGGGVVVLETAHKQTNKQTFFSNAFGKPFGKVLAAGSQRIFNWRFMGRLSTHSSTPIRSF